MAPKKDPKKPEVKEGGVRMPTPVAPPSSFGPWSPTQTPATVAPDALDAVELTGEFRRDFLNVCTVLKLTPHPSVLRRIRRPMTTQELRVYDAQRAEAEDAVRSEGRDPFFALPPRDETVELDAYDLTDPVEVLRFAHVRVDEGTLAVLARVLPAANPPVHTLIFHHADLAESHVRLLHPILRREENKIRRLHIDYNPLPEPTLDASAPPTADASEALSPVASPPPVSARGAAGGGAVRKGSVSGPSGATATATTAAKGGARAGGATPVGSSVSPRSAPAYAARRAHVFAELLAPEGQLEALSLRGNEMEAADMEALVDALWGNPIVRALDLSDNRLGVGGVRVLVQGVRENRSLRELGVARNGLTRACVADLVASITSFTLSDDERLRRETRAERLGLVLDGGPIGPLGPNGEPLSAAPKDGKDAKGGKGGAGAGASAAAAKDAKGGKGGKGAAAPTLVIEVPPLQALEKVDAAGQPWVPLPPAATTAPGAGAGAGAGGGGGGKAGDKAAAAAAAAATTTGSATAAAGAGKRSSVSAASPSPRTAAALASGLSAGGAPSAPPPAVVCWRGRGNSGLWFLDVSDNELGEKGVAALAEGVVSDSFLQQLRAYDADVAALEAATAAAAAAAAASSATTDGAPAVATTTATATATATAASKSGAGGGKSPRQSTVGGPAASTASATSASAATGGGKKGVAATAPAEAAAPALAPTPVRPVPPTQLRMLRAQRTGYARMETFSLVEAEDPVRASLAMLESVTVLGRPTPRPPASSPLRSGGRKGAGMTGTGAGVGVGVGVGVAMDGDGDEDEAEGDEEDAFDERVAASAAAAARNAPRAPPRAPPRPPPREPASPTRAGGAESKDEDEDRDKDEDKASEAWAAAPATPTFRFTGTLESSVREAVCARLRRAGIDARVE